MDDMIHHSVSGGMVSTVLDTAILVGILFTAILTIFKAGRWFGGVIDSMNHMTTSMDAFKAAFDRHTIDEEQRFASIESTMVKHGDRIGMLRDDVAKINQMIQAEANGNSNGGLRV